jgi:hypothetical protein
MIMGEAEATARRAKVTLAERCILIERLGFKVKLACF